MGADFSAEQKRYIEGFVSGLQSTRIARGLAPLGGTGAPGPSEPTGPDALHLKAQDETVAAGKKLNDQEKWKRAEHPFDAYPRLKAQAEADVYPKPEDNFRWRYYGLFYVAPAQNSYMARLRIPNGIVTHTQFAGVADLADAHGGGFIDFTTRANIQIRDIPAHAAVKLVEGVQDIGLASRGSGADNIRNVTGSPTAGIDAQELYDTRPLAREWHFHILNTRVMTGLPRKFNVAFDGGGIAPVLEETNDIGFQAVRVAGREAIMFRVVLGGISGHKDLARDTGVICTPAECTPIADAIIRVFSRHGDRTNRAKARMKYVLDDWGFDKFLAAVETELGRPLTRAAAADIAPRAGFDRHAHVGVHAQVQAGLNWVGVVAPVGRLTTTQVRGLALLARTHGDGDIRLTVWQNMLISGVPDAAVEAVTLGIEALGLDWRAHAVRAGLVACTGAAGCKFGNADTKKSALEIAAYVETRLAVDQPVNIHLTGCHHSCAQHYIGDIGLIGARVDVSGDEQVAGYDVVVGGGFADQARIGRVVYEKVVATEAPALVERLLRTWMTHRAAPDETFQAFATRHEPEALKALAENVA